MKKNSNHSYMENEAKKKPRKVKVDERVIDKIKDYLHRNDEQVYLCSKI